MPSTLKIVATPVGNIRDISLRAIDEIKRADAIFAEDTRHTLKLILALNIELKPECRLISCDSHKETNRINVVVERLLANDRVLLLSDAGCPTISDPGSLLVQGVVAQGLSVEIIPGPSAHSAALMGAGIDTTRFAFLGFLPQKKIHRKQIIEGASLAGLALIFYEAPQRVGSLLQELHQILGPRRVVVARELTKLYETFHRGVLGENLNPPFLEKGECVIVVEAGKLGEDNQALDEEELASFIQNEALKGQSAKDITGLVVSKFNIKKSVAYDFVLKLRGSFKSPHGL